MHSVHGKHATRALALLLFFLSGACGLIYEVVWTRMATHVFGTTALAVGTVLAAFMSGLALGGWVLGRLGDTSRDPLRLYAALEVGVGLTALGAHLLLGRIAPAYLAVYEAFGRSDAALGVARFLLAFALVLAPTVLMGATLPVLARFVVTRMAAVGTGLSTLYAVNVLGAVTGVVLAGFHLIGAYGIHGTVYLAVAGNLGIGAVAWLAAARASARRGADAAAGAGSAAAEAPPPEGAPVGTRTWRLLLVGLSVSGMTSFAYEITWTRSLVFLLGSSTYAVTTMLTAFLLGLALGGYLVRFLVDRLRDRAALFGWVQVLLGVTALAALPALLALTAPERLRVHLAEAEGSGGVLLLRFGVALAVMLPTATLVGATFPLVGRIGVSELRRAGSTIGRVYAVNTVGNVLGALLPGLVLLERLGIQRTILVMACLNLGLGGAVLVARLRATPRLRRALPLAAAAVALALYGAPLDFRFPTEAQTPRHRVLYYREGPTATTTVLQDPERGERSMCVDGIDIGGTGFTEYKQLLLAHLPKLLADEVGRELSVGLGSGILVGESARHSRVRSITCVEIEPSVVEGAALFERENHGVLADPRLTMVVDDVATHLRTTRERYDVVSADEKTAQEYASNGFSYSREYYELLRGRLAPGGLVVQWVPTTLPPRQYRMILRTFCGAFHHAQLWYFPPALKDGAVNTLLVASTAPIDLDLPAMRRRLAAEPEAFESLARYGLTTAASVLAAFVADGTTVRRAVARAPQNTLAHPRYEFFSPADYAMPRDERHRANHDLIVALRDAAAQEVLGGLARDEADAERLGQALEAEELFLAGARVALGGGAAQDVFVRFEQAVARAPWNRNLRARVFLAYRELAAGRVAVGDRDTALLALQRANGVFDTSAAGHLELAELLAAASEPEPALAEARRAVELEPGLGAARRLCARLLLELRREAEAAEELRALLALEPDDAEARRLLGRLPAELRR